MNSNTTLHGSKWLAAVLLLLVIFLIYSNTFNAAWQMDDHPNITDNERLHITELNRDNILRSLFANPRASKYKELYRPAACLSFGLNWFFGRDHVFGYHFVNTIIHFSAAYLLYLTIMVLFETPRLKNHFRGRTHTIALLAAMLWAIHPIQTQAVTYIVQRMAAMAALFYLLSLYFYVKARLNVTPQRRGLLFAASIISYFLAIGSKENAAMLPLALILVELIFFYNPESPKINRKIFWSAAGGALFVFLTGTLFFLKGDFFSFINAYSVRPFTLGERLLTEPRILIFYLSQIVLPLPGRLSIAHDVAVYQSLFDPMATLPAIILVFLLIGFSVWRLKKWPIISFGILFFFLNHVIESSIIPLELIFEHRNYLPSMFLFWSLAAGLCYLFDYADPPQKQPLKWVIGAAVMLIMFGLGCSTYTRNKAWNSEASLWEDVLKKAPGLARPYLVLAAEYEKQNEYEKALDYYQKSLALPDQRPLQAQGSAYNNMGTIYMKQHDYETAARLYRQALAIRPLHAMYLHHLVLALVKSRNWQAASDKADLLVSTYSNNPTYLNLKGYILLKQNKPAEAGTYLRRALSFSPRERNYTVNYGMALSLAGKTKQAEWVLSRSIQNSPADIASLMCLIENSLRSRNMQSLEHYLVKLFFSFSAKDIQDYLQELVSGNIDVPVSPKLLAPVIAAKLKEYAIDIKK
jgi:Flp pilus assembly protein TadD